MHNSDIAGRAMSSDGNELNTSLFYFFNQKENLHGSNFSWLITRQLCLIENNLPNTQNPLLMSDMPGLHAPRAYTGMLFGQWRADMPGFLKIRSLC